MNINKLRQKLCLMFSIDNVNKMLLYSIINEEFLNFLEILILKIYQVYVTLYIKKN